MDVSHLQVKVTGAGIVTVSKQLDGLGKAADNAEVKIKRATDAIDNMNGKSTSAIGQAFKDFNSVLTQVAAQLQGLVNTMNKVSNSQLSLTTSTHSLSGAFQRNAHWSGVAMSTIKAMATYTGITTFGAFTKDIVEQGDAWAALRQRLTYITGSSGNAKVAMNDLFEIAQRTRNPVESLGLLYGRLSQSMQRMGKSGQDVREVTEAVATAMKLFGTQSSEAKAAMLQLSQAFDYGRLQGAEFTSIAKAAPPLMEALAKSLHAPQGALKKMASDGKILATDMADAWQAALPKLRDEMFKMAPTFEDAVTLMKNEWTKAIGEMNDDVGFNNGLIKAVGVLRQMIPGIVQGIGEAFIGVMGWVEKNKSKLDEVWTQVKGIAKDVWGIANGFMGALGFITSAGEEISTMGLLLFTARVILAGIYDISKMVAASFVNVGLDVYEFFLMPLSLVVKAIEKVSGGMASLLDITAAGLRAIGKDEAAERTEATAKSIRGFAKDSEDWYLRAIRLGQAGRNAADKLTEGFRNGKTELQKLLDGTDEVNDAWLKVQARLPKYDNSKNHPKEAPVPDDKAAKAAARELAKFDEALDKLNDKLKAQAELREKLTHFWEGEGNKILPETKQRIDLESDLVRVMNKHGHTIEEVRHAYVLLQKAKEVEKGAIELDTLERIQTAQKKTVDSTLARAKAITEEAQALERKNAADKGTTDKQVKAMEVGDVEEQLRLLKVAHDYMNDPTVAAGMTQEILALQSLIDGYKRLGLAADEAAQIKAKADLDKLLDPKKAEHFGQAFTSAFGKIGKSIGGVLDAFTKMEVRQKRLKDIQEAYTKARLNGEKNADKYITRIQEEQAMATMSNYADMLGAVKGFFNEKSKGYKALEAAEKVFRAFEFAMEMKSFLMKSGLLEMFSGLFVAAKTEELTADVASTDIQIANAMARAQANAMEATTNQGKGDPYSAFARIAAMAAIMAAMGFATGAFGSGSVPSAPVTNTGTGTVFGDKDAKSESIKKSLDILSEVDTMTMKYSAQMLASLRSIESLLGGVTNLILRSSGIAGGDNFNIAQGVMSKNTTNPLEKALGIPANYSILGPIGGFIKALRGLWGKTTQEIEQAGVQMKGTLQQLMAGMGMSQFANVKVTSSSWFGLKKDTSYSTVNGALDPTLAKQFGMIFGSFSDAIKAAAGPLGVNLDTIDNRLKGFVLDIGQIDLKGLTGDQIKEKLAAVFGAAGDKLAQQAIPGLNAFQQVGEGYLETLVRVSSGVEQANYELEKLGIASAGLGMVLNQQGDVGGEIVKMSIQFKEMTLGLGDGISSIIMSLTGTADEIAQAYTSLKDIQRLMMNTGFGSNLSRDLLKAAGGMEAFKDALTSYQDNFFSDAEKRAMKLVNLQQDFAKIGLTMPVTKEAFRALVETLNGSGQQSLAAKVILLSDAFSEWATSMGGVDDARNNLTDAYNREKEALTTTKSKFEDFTKSLKEFRQGLVTGDLSPLSNTEKYATLKAQFDSTRNSAMSGDEDAIGKFQSVANELLQFSRDYNASGAGYNSDFQMVLDATSALEQFTAGQATEAEKQLDALNKQVEGLITINESVLTVAQAIEALRLAMVPPVVAPVAPATVVQSTSSIPATPERSTALMVDAITALRGEVAALRQENAAQAQMLAEVTIASNDQNAQDIVGGSVSTNGGTLVLTDNGQWGGF